MAHVLHPRQAFPAGHSGPHVLEIRHLLVAVGHFSEHVLFVITGLIFTAIGIGFAITIVFLPLGLFAGFGGVLLVMAGLTADSDARGRERRSAA
jgi:uncharacterized membrane protein